MPTFFDAFQTFALCASLAGVLVAIVTPGG